MPSVGGNYKYGSGSGIGGGVGTLNSGPSPYSFSTVPKYSGSGIGGGFGSLGGAGLNSDEPLGGRNKF